MLAYKRSADGLLQPGERILWHGRPSSRQFVGAAVTTAMVGLVAIAFGAFLFRAFIVKGDGHADILGLFHILMGCVSAAVFAGFGIHGLLTPWKMGSRLARVEYLLTDRRAVVITSPSRSWNPVPPMVPGQELMEFTAEQVRECRRKRKAFGRHDLIFHREFNLFYRSGGYWHEFGFFGLADPVAVERIIREDFLPEA